MNQTALLYPVSAMIALTFGVLGLVAIRRLRFARANGVQINQLPPTRQEQMGSVSFEGANGGEQGGAQSGAQNGLWDRRTAAAGDHLSNLFETPVLFYGVCLALCITQAVTALSVWLAWAYVGFRVLHAFVHVTYNLISHRFVMFSASLVALFILFLQLVISLV